MAEQIGIRIVSTNSRDRLESGSTFYCLRLLSSPGGMRSGDNSIEEELYENDEVH
jgi:hypothetical protein